MIIRRYEVRGIVPESVHSQMTCIFPVCKSSGIFISALPEDVNSRHPSGNEAPASGIIHHLYSRISPSGSFEPATSNSMLSPGAALISMGDNPSIPLITSSGLRLPEPLAAYSILAAKLLKIAG